MVIARHHGATWAYLADVHSETCVARSEPVGLGSLPPGLSHGRRTADRSAGWRFDDVIRTWLYLGDITGKEGETLSVS